MMLRNYLRALALFYRTLLPQTAVSSVLVLGVTGLGAALLQLPWPPPLGPGLLLMKLGTFPLVAYLEHRLRPHQYWFYRNLHLARWQLWTPLVVADTAGFVAFVGLLHRWAF
ncbi:hypothetical protein CDA63_19645 [Hymenobacter amundsenii]|uniref:Uncharacterized protein n=1 Tax=Hymenobacter amundsenii TaxID=2006685 RepID=A0A246FFV5_9BACT|nr:hypothetical protein [Hymenobacter amundsenii]OWP61393.1 hypothetical protein CDA63_19645 [Hymenobacter amundsenii]